jgi:hypothetical protein
MWFEVEADGICEDFVFNGSTVALLHPSTAQVNALRSIRANDKAVVLFTSLPESKLILRNLLTFSTPHNIFRTLTG